MTDLNKLENDKIKNLITKMFSTGGTKGEIIKTVEKALSEAEKTTKAKQKEIDDQIDELIKLVEPTNENVELTLGSGLNTVTISCDDNKLDTTGINDWDKVGELFSILFGYFLNEVEFNKARKLRIEHLLSNEFIESIKKIPPKDKTAETYKTKIITEFGDDKKGIKSIINVISKIYKIVEHNAIDLTIITAKDKKLYTTHAGDVNAENFFINILKINLKAALPNFIKVAVYFKDLKLEDLKF